jgi:pilus assembly protein CpaD
MMFARQGSTMITADCRRGGTRRAATVLALLAMAPALGGCFANREATGSIYPTDLRDRHPIVLTNAPRVLDIFVEGPSGVDARERTDLRAFMAEYSRYGTGPVTAQVPTGAELGGATRQALAAIRSSAGGRLSVVSYRPIDPALASPIRLSFVRLQAKVSDRCGLWPKDLGVSDAESNFRNEPYWNFGCAMQSNVAAQVADPVDLVRGRPETPPDTIRRMGNIGKIREGNDPSTNYRQDSLNKISTTVGN